ncbi:MAG: metalloregulator ArsR/SmtB family transcription factor [Chloroflexi bacterium]|nr:metalloregulator ArsR/SmtB family transcription factor [Chloroflexota bacterium]
MSHRPFKQRLYPLFARVGHALASDRRLELLDLLAQSPRHVEALAAETEMSVASVSQHLQVLRNAHLVETEREGTKVRYRLAGDDVLQLWLSLRSVAERRLAEVAQLTREFAVEGVGEAEVSRDDLQALIDQGKIMLIDVRPRLEFDNGHLPGAVSMPADELPGRLETLPKRRRIVAYCRGTYCLFADEAVALLRREGFDAVRLDGGWPEWVAEGRAAE